MIINARYGTYRGMIRLIIDSIKMYLGVYTRYQNIDWSQVKRLVFVCQGNICRSPYGHFIALSQGIKNVASLGYATTTGLGANPQAMKVAQDRGISLASHITTDIHDFEFCDGDLLLVMEDRHLTKISGINKQDKAVQVSMLGLWDTPKLALLYDPHKLSDEYFHQCYANIESATHKVIAKFQLANKLDAHLK
jgi:protein-tyrosine phosphatase